MLKSLLNFGVVPLMSITEQRKVRLLNFLCLLLILVQPFAILSYAIQRNILGEATSVIDIFAAMLTLYLQGKQKFHLARLLIFSYYPLSLFFQINILQAPEIQLFWGTVLIGIFFLFEKSFWRIFFFIYVGLLVIISYYYLNYDFQAPFIWAKFVPNFVNIFVLVAALLIATYQMLSFFEKNTMYFQKLTEEKNQEILQQNEEILQQSEYLNEMNRLKDRLFSVIAHDLRNPVAALRNTIDILDPKILSSEELKFIKAELIQQFNSVDFTLNNLLTWARGQIKGEILHIEVINIHKIVEESIENFTVFSSSKNIAIVNDVSKHTQVHADLNHLQFLLRNLLNNAIKFSQRQGVVTIFAYEDERFTVIAVKDKGVGISPEKQSYLFDIHSNFTTEGTQGEKGTGLGLILCKEFAEKNGGKIWVESEVGKGSTFYFTLPKSRSIG